MKKKIKTLLIVLGIVSLSGAGLSAWIYFSAQTEIARYARKHSELEKRNTRLGERLDAAEKQARQWQGKSESITAALNKLGKEHTLLQGQYTSLLKEKDSLVEEYRGVSGQLEKLKALYSEEQKKPKKINASDEFLSSLLEEKALLQVEIEKLREQIEGAERQMRPSQEKLAQLEAEKGMLERKLEDIEKASGLLSSDLLRERKKRTAMEEELAKTEARLRETIRDKDGLAEQLTGMKQALEQRLAELSGTKKVLESAVEGAKEATRRREPVSIELPPIVVKAEPVIKRLSKPAEQEKASAPTELSRVRMAEEEAFELEGHIITVNDKHRFVVIDIGRDNGVQRGMPFSVYRAGKKVGKIEVIETRENIAACDIKEMKVRRLKVNDTARR